MAKPATTRGQTGHEAAVAAQAEPATSALDVMLETRAQCPHCTADNPVTARFCGGCGARLPDRYVDSERRDVAVRVRAKAVGFFNNQRYREGDVFVLPPPAPGQREPFSDKWMELVPDSTPERVTTGQQAIRKEHDETLSAVKRVEPTGGQDVL